jgi:nonsense-mediated mRNA decay protein 3
VEHKRTFLFLEQLILKHSAEENAVGVKEAPDGLDFFYAHRSHALKMVDFLNSVVAIRSRADKQLVSADHNSNTFNYKYTFSIELVPVCKEDLVCLPHKVYSALGGLGPVLLCVRVSNQLTLVDVTTLRAAHVDAVAYWRAPYKALMSAAALVEFIVLDVEPLPVHGGGGGHGSSGGGTSVASAVTSTRWLLADVTVAKASDFGRNDAQLVTRTHLGALLKPGDTVLGYDVAGAVLVDPELDTYRGLQLPDVILVRKSYAARRRQRRQKAKAARPWTLRRLAMESADDDGGPLAHGGRHAADVRAAEEEAFLEEIEEDPELRARIALYRRAEAQQQRHRQQHHPPGGEGDGMGEEEDEEEEDDIPEVPLEELLEEMTLTGGGDEDMDE